MKSKLIETQPPAITTIANQPAGEFIPGLRTACAATMIFMIVSAVAMIIYNRLSKRRLHLFEIKAGQVTPCHRCQYLGDDTYLRCALHPSTVLTEQAIDCQDYYPNTKGRVW